VGFSGLLFKKFDVIHVHFFSYHFFLALLYKLLFLKTKIIVTVHGSDTANVTKWFYRPFLKYISKIIAVGKEQAKVIRQVVGSDKVVALSAGVDERVFYHMPGTSKEFDFIFVGSFYDVKGVDVFIRAIGLSDHTDKKYCFVGSGKYLSEIEELRKEHNITIKMNQTHDEIRELLNKSKWLVLPSRGDSFGLVVSEAIYCGTPVIVSNIGGMREQVDDGVNGFVLEDNTPEALAKKMAELKDIPKHEYKAMVENCLASNKQFSLRNVCEELVRIYNE
jgi:glycosyltransferase involved in cell wall biosynthesis